MFGWRDLIGFNLEGLILQKSNTPMDKAQKVAEKNGTIRLMIMFTPSVMAIKTTLKQLIFYFLLH